MCVCVCVCARARVRVCGEGGVEDLRLVCDIKWGGEGEEGGRKGREEARERGSEGETKESLGVGGASLGSDSDLTQR